MWQMIQDSTNSLTQSKRRIAKSQSSVGCSNQSVRTDGTWYETIPSIIQDTESVVVDFLVRLSARTADGVDTRGRCSICTEQPR